MEYLAAARAAAGSGQVAKAPGGKGKGKGKGSDDKALLKALKSLAIVHERSINTLLDRSTFVVVVKNEAVKKDLYELRTIWRTEEKKRKADRPKPPAAAGGEGPAAMEADEGGAAVAGAPQPAGPPPEMAKHPMGSQRSLLHKLIFEKMEGLASQEFKATAKELASMAPANVDQAVFRLKPRHDDPKEGSAWVWSILLSETPEPGYRERLVRLAGFRSTEMFVSAQHSADGPIVKWLTGGGGDGDEEVGNVASKKRKGN